MTTIERYNYRKAPDPVTPAFLDKEHATIQRCIASVAWIQGIWMPVIGGVGGTSGQSYTTQTGVFQQIAGTIIARFDVALSNKGTITGNAQLSGFPFAPLGEVAWMMGYWDALGSSPITMPVRMQAGTTAALLYKLTAGSSASYSTPMATADLTNTTRFIGTVVYDV